ncbi:MAG: 4Fe-4S binding protein [Motiliproteus sp.]
MNRQNRAPLSALIKHLCIALILLCSFQIHAVEMPLTSPLKKIFPTASHTDPADKDLAILPVYRLNQLEGYAFHTAELAPVRGYGGKPIDIMIGLDPKGRYTGFATIDHHEPIFLKGNGPSKLEQYMAQLIGAPASDRIYIRGDNQATLKGGENSVYIDGISSATVTTHAINKTITRAARAAARAKELAGYSSPTRYLPKTDLFESLSLQQLLDRGLVKHWPIYAPQIESAKQAKQLGYPSQPIAMNDQPPLTEFYLAYMSHPLVSKNLLSDSAFSRWNKEITGSTTTNSATANNDQYLLLLSRGQLPSDNLSSIFTIQQRGMNVVSNRADFSPYADQLKAPLGNVEHIELIKIPTVASYDPTARTNLIFSARPTTKLKESYQLPKQYFNKIQATAPQDSPLWHQLWQQRQFQIAILLLGLVLLTVLFVMQHSLASKSTLFHRIRWGYLAFTLGFIGFYAQGQLSIVNVLTLQHLFLDGTSLDLFLLDPITCILWCYVLVSLVIFGRGLYCGWLCPFGALQEFAGWLAKRLQIKPLQIKRPWHQRLQKLKYLLFGSIVIVSFYSLALAEQLAELEPFKTVTTLFFQREWSYVLYALVLLLVAMKIHKVYCRYVCPLGAGLAILGAIPIFNWLTRRAECGTPCQSCRRQCEIDAIAVTGDIDMKECIQCLECVVIYQDPKLCAIDVATVKKQRLYDKRQQQLLIAKAD